MTSDREIVDSIHNFALFLFYPTPINYSFRLNGFRLNVLIRVLVVRYLMPVLECDHDHIYPENECAKVAEKTKDRNFQEAWLHIGGT